MGEALKEIKLPDSRDILVEEPPIIPPTHVHLQTLKPIFRVSPHGSGSTLYDSYELRAVTNQLNQAMQGYNGAPNLLSFLKSPFYSQRLDRTYRQNSKSPKGITYPKLAHVSFDRKASTTGTKSASGSLVSRLWQKVRKELSRTKQTSKG
ncbi:hypothetical protein POPTR_012G066250v4 [Populus trichocarpa]|jgi:hypothetical protein|uniref:Uncharacterized protein n=1 Tax=Populus trichocarpa TaxID=3694 RepID=A0ACC0S607_POPTR|nr:hypothetical protein BDE02_12G050300 [Populus trichocarpa]KAI9384468.1 hypothetical protein POPTR_012G066250v4 [Populus trichocarpa]